MTSSKEPSGCARAAYGFETLFWILMLALSVFGTVIAISDERPGALVGMGVACALISLVGGGLAAHALTRGHGLLAQGGAAAALAIARIVIWFFLIAGTIVVGVMGVTA